MADLVKFDFDPEQSAEYWSETVRTSAFFAASTETVLPVNGTAIPVIGKATAGWQANAGDRKHVSVPNISNRVIEPYTVATIIPVDKNAVQDQEALFEAILTEGRSAIAETIDKTVAGEVTAPGANFGTLGALTETVVTDRKSFIEALKAVRAGGVVADYAVLSTELFYDLISIENSFGQPVLTVADDRINGIPYSISDALTGSVGFLGAFKRMSRFGRVGNLTAEIGAQATWTDPTTGQLVSGFERNLVAVRIEQRVGFNYANIDNFVRIGVAEDAPEGA